MMNIDILIFSVFVASFFSCASSGKLCDASNPNDIPFIKQIIQDYNTSGSSAKAEIIHYSYKGSDVFLVDLCKGCPDYLTRIYNCEGKIICESGGITGKMTCPDFFDVAEKKKVIWSNQ